MYEDVMVGARKTPSLTLESSFNELNGMQDKAIADTFHRQRVYSKI